MAKIGTKAGTHADLVHKAERTPKIITGKITENLISKHAKDARAKQERDKKKEI